MIRRRAGLPAAELRLFAILRHLEYEYAKLMADPGHRASDRSKFSAGGEFAWRH